jgi:thioredoxin-like negative regulator of GroEL
MRKSSYIVPALVALLVVAFVVHGFWNRGEYGISPGTARDTPSAFTDGRPNLVAVTFYSAWCSACALLEPRLRALTPEFEGRAVEFAKFDFSLGQPESLAQKAELLGIESVYAGNKGATGFMALVDRRSQHVLATITFTRSDEEIREMLEAAIRRASMSSTGQALSAL